MTQTHNQPCAIAQALNIFGDNWTWLIIREAFYGVSRFSEFQRNIGIAKNLLSNRLSTLVEQGIFEKKNVGENGTRYSYHLTPKGAALRTPLFAILLWGNEYISGDGNEAVLLTERNTGRQLTTMSLVSESGEPIEPNDVRAIAGPGANQEILDKFENARNLKKQK
ncbi:winged helix-turn-helix transcriptional regulator [Hirschia maritima]|uniref:winged helix-turn-helix transcriptional regulator n=1 Tax=Hirschia maritima TaxID=1121961 RepID=UPI00035E601E|nr:helix-turn-helix domain-containing protein [Hirschia maritima]